jgi:spore coat assembly protein
MEKLKKGDIVGRKSYNNDILFVIKKIIELSNGEKLVILKGVTERIEADSDINDLCLIRKEILDNNLRSLDLKLTERIAYQKIENKKEKSLAKKDYRTIEKVVTGKILHLDGDRRYSQKSLRYYKEMGLNAIVKNVPESNQPKVVYNLLKYYDPDILVITGHDGMIKTESGYNDIYNYRNSKYFIRTVKEARRYDKENNKNLVIFAGACQSYFEALISAGANFASSPARILIDFLDPLIVAEKVALTDKYRYITINDIENELRDGKKGIDGIGANRKKDN